MWKKLAVVGSVVAVAGLGAGGVASAWSGAPAAQAGVTSQVGAVIEAPANTTSPTTTGPTTNTSSKKHDKKHASLAKRLSRVSHAQWVSKDAKTGTFVTHDAVRGEVTATTAGSITIKATDGTTETFVVSGSTKVRVAGATGTIAQVKVGDRAAVAGTGSAPMTATRVVDRGAAGTKHTGTKRNGSKHAGTQHPAGGAQSGTGTAQSTTAPSTTVPPTS